MNYKGKTNYSVLPVCPVCGLDSGQRKESAEHPNQYFVVCESCGYRVGPYGTVSAAVYAWKRGKR